MSHARPFRFGVMAQKASSGAAWTEIRADALDAFAPVVAKLAGS